MHLKPETLERIAKAQQAAAMLADDIREAHKGAPALVELHLRPLIAQSVAISQALAVLVAACVDG